MCGAHLGSSNRLARKNHRCCACCLLIPRGREYTISSDIDDGSVSSSKWHTQCFDEFSKMLNDAGEDCGDPYSTWENGMPQEIQATYFHGPWEIEA